MFISFKKIKQFYQRDIILKLNNFVSKEANVCRLFIKNLTRNSRSHQNIRLLEREKYKHTGNPCVIFK